MLTNNLHIVIARPAPDQDAETGPKLTRVIVGRATPPPNWVRRDNGPYRA
jgi:hypothetical protein